MSSLTPVPKTPKNCLAKHRVAMTPSCLRQKVPGDMAHVSSTRQALHCTEGDGMNGIFHQVSLPTRREPGPEHVDVQDEALGVPLLPPPACPGAPQGARQPCGACSAP